MRKNISFVILLFSVFISFYACNIKIENNFCTKFESPFQKNYKNLVWKLGNQIVLANDGDTTVYNIDYDRKTKHNLIFDTTANDTVFYGTVCKYKGLYFLNEKIADSTYWIYAIKIDNDKITGFNSLFLQMNKLDKKYKKLLNLEDFENDEFPMIQSVDKEASLIILKPDKKSMLSFYNSIIDSTIAYYFVKNSSIPEVEMETSQEADSFIFADNNQIVDKIFPNPVQKILHIDLILPNCTYKIIDIKGNIIKDGKFEDQRNQLVVSYFSKGEYLIILETEDNIIETHKFVVID